MAVQVFRDQEGDYFEWIFSNPDGFVVNSRRNPKPEYMVLHRAICPTVDRYLGLAKHGAFTTRSYIKVCSRSIPELRAWAKSLGAGDFSKHCAHCRALDQGTQEIDAADDNTAALIEHERVQLANGGFPDSETRRAVERAAVAFVWERLEMEGYAVTDHQAASKGYDLVAIKGSQRLCVEVKGTDSSVPRFFLTRNEYRCSQELKGWQLRVVTEARNAPQQHAFSASEMVKVFSLNPMAWECRRVDA